MAKDIQLGIIGYPLGHSLSPILQAELLKATGLTGTYTPYSIVPDALNSSLQELATSGLRGVNVTIPHKVSVMSLLDQIQPDAQLTGAVNTIVFENKGHHKVGHNTDFIGFIRSLPDEVINRLPESNILILGAGGSARAILNALVQLKTASVTFAVRNPESAFSIINHLDAMNQFHQSQTVAHYSALHELPALEGFQGIVNTTPVGMWPKVQETPLSAIQLETLPPGSFVYDLVYRPLETQLLIDAKNLNQLTLNGLDMLIYQGIAAFELWTKTTVSEKIVPHLRKTLTQAVLHPIQ